MQGGRTKRGHCLPTTNLPVLATNRNSVPEGASAGVGMDGYGVCNTKGMLPTSSFTSRRLPFPGLPSSLSLYKEEDEA